jgi:hypothetical protein
MIKLFKKYSVSILTKSWEPLKQRVKIKYIPRHGELIYIEDTQKYYKVLNVIYYLNNKEGIFIIVDEFVDETPLL